MADVLTPPVTWYQRPGFVNFKLHVHGAKNIKTDLKNEGFSFDGESEDGKKYHCEFSFNAAVNPDSVKSAIRPTEVEFIVDKTEAVWWDRFTSNSPTPRYIKIDWSHWKDEDETDNKEPDVGGMDFGMPGMGGMGGMPGMGGMGGMPGMGGMDFSNMDFSKFAGMGGEGDEEEDDDEEAVAPPASE
ncbi:MAG: hypothetical protein Q8P67_17895 [archaeon]|nr:hypothetical protein [archaeon]